MKFRFIEPQPLGGATDAGFSSRLSLPPMGYAGLGAVAVINKINFI